MNTSTFDDTKTQVIHDYFVELGLGYSPSISSLEQQLIAQNSQAKSDKLWAVPSYGFSARADAKFARATDPTELPGASDKDFWKLGVLLISLDWRAGIYAFSGAILAQFTYIAASSDLDNLKMLAMIKSFVAITTFFSLLVPGLGFIILVPIEKVSNPEKICLIILT